LHSRVWRPLHRALTGALLPGMTTVGVTSTMNSLVAAGGATAALAPS
jgi:hypothetical protein